MAEIKKIEGEIDFGGHLGEALAELVSQYVSGTFEVSNPYAYFQAEMAEAEMGNDWTEIRITLPLGKSENDEPKFVLSLREMVMDVLDGNCPGDGSPWPENHEKAMIRQLPITLRELADLVDDELNRTISLSPESDSAP